MKDLYNVYVIAVHSKDGEFIGFYGKPEAYMYETEEEANKQKEWLSSIGANVDKVIEVKSAALLFAV